MPNHMHGIISIQNPVGAYGNTSKCTNHDNAGTYGNISLRLPFGNIGAIVRGYKSTVAKQINQLRQSPEEPVCQRNYYENIIRNDGAYRNISQYIIEKSKEMERG